MFDYSKLRGRIKEIYGTQEKFAEKLGISKSAMSQRLNNITEFSQEEMYLSCELLRVSRSEIPEYFFCRKSSETRTI